MLQKHEAEELEKMKGMSPEMIARKKSKKSPHIQTIEKLMNTVSQNVHGQKINGREMRRPDVKMNERLQRFATKSPSPLGMNRKGSGSKLILNEDQEREAKDFTKSILR